MRLFIALDFDAAALRRICAVQERLKKLGKANFSQPENIHLTLAFLGETAPERLDAIRRAIARTSATPIALCFDRIGSFARPDGDIFWIGLAESQSLCALQSDLCTHLSDAGFRLEARHFKPHITLARGMRLPSKINTSDLLGAPFTGLSGEIRLMQSQRIGGRLVYTPV